MNCNDIITQKLKELGADGLCTVDCGCELGDLGACEWNCLACEPARRTIATEDGEYHDVGDEIFVPLEP